MCDSENNFKNLCLGKDLTSCLKIDIPAEDLGGMAASRPGSHDFGFVPTGFVPTGFVPDIHSKSTPMSPGSGFTSAFSIPPLTPTGPLSPSGHFTSGGVYDPVDSFYDMFVAPQLGRTPQIGGHIRHDFSTTSVMGHTYDDTPAPGEEEFQVKAVIKEAGYISLRLRYGVTVDIAANQAIRVVNPNKSVTLGLTGDGLKMAMVHPQGRACQYNDRIEVQVEEGRTIKNAKIWPKGISFTSNEREPRLTYLVDSAGARLQDGECFYDLYGHISQFSHPNIADAIFTNSSGVYLNGYTAAIQQCQRDLYEAQYWKTAENDCWMINNVRVTQTLDGLVTVGRKYGNEQFAMRTSPTNGKCRLESSFVYMTASMGDEAHVFIKSNERRIHYNGTAFVVRNAGHSAGYDENGDLRIW